MKYKNKGFSKQLRHDLACGALRQWKRVIPFVVMYAVFCYFFALSCSNEKWMGNVSGQPVMADYIVYLLRGMRAYDPFSKQPFKPPISWLVMQLFVAFYTGSYAYDDMGSLGQQYLLRSVKKTHWFLGKCFCCLADVMICYLSVWAVCLVFSAVEGRVALQPTEDIGRFVSGMTVTLRNSSEFVFYLGFMPLLTSWVLSMTQMLLSLYLRPAPAMAFVLVYEVASAYVTSYGLIGNYSMILRNEKFAFGGLNTGICVGVELVLAACILLLGCFLQKRFDYLEK